ncbi:MAG: iron ABC transporter permease [Thermoleophilia bacterium]
MLAGVAVLVGCGLAGILIGPVHIPLRGVLLELVDRLPLVHADSGLSEQQRAILWDIRMPRVVLGGLVGGTLAMGGAAYQGVFRNPLADPYLLGVASGAGLGATVAIVWFPGAAVAGVAMLPVLAFAGGLLAVLMALAVGRALGEGRSSTTLILGGVAVSTFLTAVQTFAQQHRDDSLRQVYDWVLGRLSTSQWTEVRLVLPYVVVSWTAVLLHGRLMDVLSLGDDAAGHLGVRVARVRMVVVAAVTLGTAAVVAVSGLIGFVGIVAPHVVRLLGVRGHRALLPVVALAGGAFLIVCDLAARTVLSPQELPIGVVTALVGAPVFAFVLGSRRAGGGA